MKYTYKTQGTCSSHIELEIENNIITDIAFWGGCNGNLQGLSRLVKGMSVNDVISRLEGVRCVEAGKSGYSCGNHERTRLSRLPLDSHCGWKKL